MHREKFTKPKGFAKLANLRSQTGAPDSATYLPLARPPTFKWFCKDVVVQWDGHTILCCMPAPSFTVPFSRLSLSGNCVCKGSKRGTERLLMSKNVCALPRVCGMCPES